MPASQDGLRPRRRLRPRQSALKPRPLGRAVRTGDHAGARLGQRALQGAVDEVVDQARVAEAHLVLGRMHVDVDAARVEFEEQHVGRLAAMEQHVGIGLLHRMRDAAVAHGATVDVEVLLVGAGAVVGRLADPAMQAQARPPAWSTRSALRANSSPSASCRRTSRQQVALALPAPRRLAVVGDAQFHVRPRQRQLPQPFLDVAQLGALGLEELAPRRHVEEQVAHFDRGALRVRLGRDRADPAAFDLQRCAVLVAGAARGQREAADRGDRRQRLAAEAERGHAFEVVERGDLAGGVARDRQRQFVGGDAAAVVADADQAHAALFQVDVDAARTGIERVLHQFLDHGRRALDDLAGGDLVDEGVGELADRHGVGDAGLRRRKNRR